MKNLWELLLVGGGLVLIDLYVFQAVKLLTSDLKPPLKRIIHGLYWLITVVMILRICIWPRWDTGYGDSVGRIYIVAVLSGIYIGKIVVCLFLGGDDLRRAIVWVMKKWPAGTRADSPETTLSINRSVFLSWMGLAAGSTFFGTLLYGFSNIYCFRVRPVTLHFDRLPAAFKGIRIVQISDIHAGSFTDKQAVEKGVELIMRQNPDLILFTGDLVNDRAEEMSDYINLFSRLRAPLGIYSILGNHDYGDYTEWKNDAEKAANFGHLKMVHAQLGWRLLLNEHVLLEKEGAQIALIGVENWSAKDNFQKYGQLNKACSGTQEYPFKILLSHDPSHWDAEVLQRHADIDLTLSGHTHGMQFGLELPGVQWSPIQYIYNRWAGLYETANQKLYVNRGFGFLGYPGRVGILPEITLLNLL